MSKSKVLPCQLSPKNLDQIAIGVSDPRIPISITHSAKELQSLWDTDRTPNAELSLTMHQFKAFNAARMRKQGETLTFSPFQLKNMAKSSVNPRNQLQFVKLEDIARPSGRAPQAPVQPPQPEVEAPEVEAQPLMQVETAPASPDVSGEPDSERDDNVAAPELPSLSQSTSALPKPKRGRPKKPQQ